MSIKYNPAYIYFQLFGLLKYTNIIGSTFISLEYFSQKEQQFELKSDQTRLTRHIADGLHTS